MADSPLKATIVEAASKPQAVSGDEGSVTEHNLKDLIQANEALQREESGKRRVGIRVQRLRTGPPGGA